MGRDIYHVFSNMDIRDLTISIFGKDKVDTLLKGSSKEDSLDSIDFTVLNEKSINAINGILKKENMSFTDMQNIMTFLINRACAIEDIPVPKYEFDVIMTDDIFNPTSNTIMHGQYGNDSIKICLTDADGKLNNIYDVIDTTMHELFHYFAECDLKEGIISARAFNSMLTKIFRQHLSTSNYDEYRNNYFNKESEREANRFGANSVVEFIKEFVPESKKSKEVAQEYNKKIIEEYTKQTTAMPTDIHGDKYPLFEYNVKNLTMIIRRRPYLLQMYPMLNEFYEIDKDGRVNIKLSNIIRLCEAIEDAYYAESISEITKDEDLAFLDSFIWSCAQKNTFKHYPLNAPTEEEKSRRREGIYASFNRMYERFMEASYYDKAADNINGFITSQRFLSHIYIMLNMRNAVYASGEAYDESLIDISAMDVCLENVINYASELLNGSIENLSSSVLATFNDIIEKWRILKNERLDGSDTRK